MLFLVFLVMVATVVVAAGRYRGCKSAPDGPSKDVTFTVADGATANAVVNDLASAGLVRCGGFVGSLLIRGTGKASEIRAGAYTLTRGMDLDQIMAVLTTPPPKVPTVNVLIPPGYRLTQIAARVQQALGIPAEGVPRRRQQRRLRARAVPPQGNPHGRGLPLPRDVPLREGGHDGR